MRADRDLHPGRRSTVAPPATTLLALFTLSAPAAITAQSPGVMLEAATPAVRPFAVGERLTYVARVSKLGKVGRGFLVVEAQEAVRGTETLLLRFDFRTRVGPVKVVNQSESWLDPVRMASLRFHKHERHPLSNHDELVELYPEQRRWEGADGTRGESLSDVPLDELSFIYFIRTLPLTADTTYSLDRHFDAARNPTTVRVMGRETVTTPMGEFPTVVVEMRVQDSRRYRGEGVIRIHLSDDARRLPVRIETAAPLVGKAVLLLESYGTTGADSVAGAP